MPSFALCQNMDTRVTRLITEAEQFIESRLYGEALELLADAELIEPENKSIHLIRELVRNLRSEQEKPSALRSLFTFTATEEEPASNREEQERTIQKRVRNLIVSAEHFLSRGAVDNAFESLMRAYLLDPLAPEVLECERRVLPAWQKLHGISTSKPHTEWRIRSGAKRQARGTLFERLRAGKLLG
ncbi:MAG: hypothetical protein KF749_08890 [Bacteroidetes bacterium]|nr:hypothetical protein [Bacteroidota bacterium]MCW5894739.1 hypothetical protein [Bacteroidota bacterium]